VTAPVWQRGIIQEEFGVPMTSVTFYSGAVEPSATPRTSKIPHSLPPGITVQPIPAGKNLSAMLAAGEIDALFTAIKPSSFTTSPNVTYLFPNFKEVEAEYFRRTGIFPIMHTVVIKRDVYERNRWVAKTLQKAFAQSLDLAYEAIEERGALRYVLPWLEEHVEETKRLMDVDGGKGLGNGRWWNDGFQENRHVLEKFLEYHHEQGLSKRRLKPEELFAPETFETFVL
jgi:4,5-dihydroxyphthalate decarboxylase